MARVVHKAFRYPGSVAAPSHIHLMAPCPGQPALALPSQASSLSSGGPELTFHRSFVTSSWICPSHGLIPEQALRPEGGSQTIWQGFLPSHDGVNFGSCALLGGGVGGVVTWRETEGLYQEKNGRRQDSRRSLTCSQTCRPKMCHLHAGIILG